MALSDQMGKQQQNLQKVVNAMTKHKAQQSKAFSFDMPESVQVCSHLCVFKHNLLIIQRIVFKIQFQQMASQRANDSTDQYSFEQPHYQPNFLQPRNRNEQVSGFFVNTYTNAVSLEWFTTAHS